MLVMHHHTVNSHVVCFEQKRVINDFTVILSHGEAIRDHQISPPSLMFDTAVLEVAALFEKL